MIENEGSSAQTVLMLATENTDAASALEVLSDGGIAASRCANLDCLSTCLQQSYGAVIVTEESLAGADPGYFEKIFAKQESWSDLPVILITNKDSIWATEIFSRSGNISILERPLSRLTLLRSVEVALRARRRQYRVRSILQEQEKATQARDEFFATLSHELRTPLNVILGWLEILRDNHLDGAARAEALEILERNAKVQKTLIDDLLDVSRIITNKMLVEMSLISLGDLLRLLAASFAPRAQEKRLTLLTNIPNGNFPVMADEGRLSQIISNLLVNSIKFTPAKGCITISLEAQASGYIVRVQDNGQGIEPQFLDSIFDRLKQEDMSTTRAHGGLGLGLAISYYLAVQHDGKLTAFSAGRGQGATLTLTLPIPKTEKAAQLSSAFTKTPIASLNLLRVLIVDDSLDILTLLKLWLTRAGATVATASSAPEALKLIGEFKPDVLLSDIGMPGMDGYQLISAVRALPANQGGTIPAGALTAYARDEEKNLVLRAGFQMHISKPIAHPELLNAITALAGLRRL